MAHVACWRGGGGGKTFVGCVDVCLHTAAVTAAVAVATDWLLRFLNDALNRVSMYTVYMLYVQCEQHTYMYIQTQQTRFNTLAS